MSEYDKWTRRRALLWVLLLFTAALYSFAPISFKPCKETPDMTQTQDQRTLAFYADDTAYAAVTFQAEDTHIPGVQVSGGGTAAPMAADTALDRQASGETAAGTSDVNAGTALSERGSTAEQLAEEEQKLRELLSGDKDAYHIKVNRTQNTVTVYEKDESGAYTVPVRAMVCSSGNKTPQGEYHTSKKYEWRPLFGGVFGQYATRIVGNILFHSVPYTDARKDALEYEEYNKLGTSASMGCIRLSVGDAKWLYDYCAVGTLVTIYEDEDPGPLGKPEPFVIDVDHPNRGWDPTDPDPENPWLIESSGENILSD